MKTALLATLGLALGATAALAADLPSRRAPPVFVAPVVPFSWTGFEVGLHSAYTFGTENRVTTRGFGTNANDIRPGYLSTKKSGSSNVGAGFGYNYQFTPGSGAVIGFSVDADWVDLSKNAYYFTRPATLSLYHQRLDYLGTANGKLGYAFDHFLVYGTGGFAFGDPGVGAVFSAPGALANRYIGGNNGNLKGGYDFGGGIAYAIPNDSYLNNLAIEKLIGLDKFVPFLANSTATLKLEYIHYNLGTTSVGIASTGIAGAPGIYRTNFRTEGNQVRAGILYTFLTNPVVPVVARY